ncbi:hypothetical protein RHGRI_004578 [Rhododendron griersonianum]|uniref:Polyphenol oxidase n=1 Tax=Rhododendron griersonianum TaxID=479676 RepID=A0AAV6LA72_9ERIC|nr:hypothetical protein RHGRI_004578 [Rhododendron griersonianum]
MLNGVGSLATGGGHLMQGLPSCNVWSLLGDNGATASSYWRLVGFPSRPRGVIWWWFVSLLGGGWCRCSGDRGWGIRDGFAGFVAVELRECSDLQWNLGFRQLVVARWQLAFEAEDGKGAKTITCASDSLIECICFVSPITLDNLLYVAIDLVGLMLLRCDDVVALDAIGKGSISMISWSLNRVGGRRDGSRPGGVKAEESGFLFYDENANLIRAKVKDCLAKPTPRVSKIFKKVKKAVSSFGVVMAAVEVPSATSVFPGKLDKTVKVIVLRPKKSRSKEEKEEEEEVLLIDGIEVERDVFVKFDVLINDEDEATSGAHKTEFAGSFVNVPHKHEHHKKIKTKLRLGISELLEDLGADDDENVLVTLVPRSGVGDVSIDGVKIEFD